jgi:methylenetetrahydrofolate reductase (NADPH)
MNLREKIKAGQFVVTAELGPPQSCNGSIIRKKAEHFRNIVDGVNITDNQTAIVRLSSIAAAKMLIEEGLEPVIQMTCRDRNRIAIQSDLLGAAALGVENVLCLTGDYQTFGNHPESKGVFDLDSIQLIATIASLNKGFLLSGDEMKKPPSFFIGGAANPFADPLEFRILRLEKKIDAGVQFIQTQPVFDMIRFIEWINKIKKTNIYNKVAILAGVMPVKSVKALYHMQAEVPGMRIAPEIIHRMENTSDPKEEGVKIAVETICELKKITGIRGIHLMPLMWESITPRLIEESGLLLK